MTATDVTPLRAVRMVSVRVPGRDERATLLRSAAQQPISPFFLNLGLEALAHHSLEPVDVFRTWGSYLGAVKSHGGGSGLAREYLDVLLDGFSAEPASEPGRRSA